MSATGSPSIPLTTRRGSPRPAEGLPDIYALPGDALLTRKQLAALTGFTEQAFKKWAKEGRGPATFSVEGYPRTTVRSYLEWVGRHQEPAR